MRRLALALIFAAAAIGARAQDIAGGIAGGLDIGRAEELASKASDEVMAKEAEAEAALRSVDTARADFFPKLSGSVSGAYLVNPPVGVTVKKGQLNQTTNPFTGATIYTPDKDLAIVPDAKNSYFKGNLTFTQPLYAWGKIHAAVDLASLEARTAAIGSRGASLDAVRSANRAYYSALLSRESAAILKELRAMAASILEDRQSALDEGFATREQLLSSEADLAALDARLVQAGESEASALEALGLLTGLDGSAIVLVSPFRDALPPLSEAALKDEALASAPDIDLARAKLSQASKKLDLERGSSLFLPDLSLFASFDVSGQDIPFSSGAWWQNNWAWDLSLGLAAKADFFDGGASAARKREAASSLEAARIGAGAAQKAVRLQVRRAIDAARGAQAELLEKQARAAWAAEALRNERAKAADQAASRAELNGQGIVEATARLDLLYARYALEESIADLERAAGKAFGAEGAAP
jgi:outer membrane protein TolC